MSRASTLRYQRRGPGGPTAKYTGGVGSAPVEVRLEPVIMAEGRDRVGQLFRDIDGKPWRHYEGEFAFPIRITRYDIEYRETFSEWYDDWASREPDWMDEFGWWLRDEDLIWIVPKPIAKLRQLRKLLGNKSGKPAKPEKPRRPGRRKALRAVERKMDALEASPIYKEEVVAIWDCTRQDYMYRIDRVEDRKATVRLENRLEREYELLTKGKRPNPRKARERYERANRKRDIAEYELEQELDREEREAMAKLLLDDIKQWHKNVCMTCGDPQCPGGMGCKYADSVTDDLVKDDPKEPGEVRAEVCEECRKPKALCTCYMVCEHCGCEFRDCYVLEDEIKDKRFPPVHHDFASFDASGGETHRAGFVEKLKF